MAAEKLTEDELGLARKNYQKHESAPNFTIAREKVGRLLATIDALAARVEASEAALRPFAAAYESSKPFAVERYADGAVWAANFSEIEDVITVGHLRNAAKTLGQF